MSWPPCRPSKPPGRRSPRLRSPPRPGCPPGWSTPTAFREHLQAARQRQTERGHAPEPAAPPARGEPVTQASLRTDLAVAQNEIRRLRAERDKLRGRLRLQLGAEIDGPDRADLTARVAALEAASRQFAAERDARAAEASHAQRRVLELEDELTAARESLRRAIRQANR